MGRAAHAATRGALDNRSRRPTMTTLVDTIQELLDGAPTPSLRSLEDTLTSGYAHALTLEGQRLRIERRLRELVRTERTSASVEEIADLTERLDDTDVDLAHLRAMLATLRKHVYDPSVAAAGRSRRSRS